MTLKQKAGKFIISLLGITKENFEILRYELNAIRVRIDSKINPFKIKKIKRFVNQEDLSVNIGAGPFGEEGWVNIDMLRRKNIVFTYDCRRKMPFKSNSINRIRCEHVLEHLDRKEEVPFFLKECYRCMKPGAVLRVIVPDVKLFIKAYYENSKEGWDKLKESFFGFDEEWLPMDVLNHIFRQDGEHKYGYDFETLLFSLKKAGFSNIQQSSYRNSHDPLLVNDQANHRFHSLYMEAIK